MRGKKVESFDVRPQLFSTSNRIRRGRIRGEDGSQMATFLGYLAKVVGNSERMNLLVVPQKQESSGEDVC